MRLLLLLISVCILVGCSRGEFAPYDSKCKQKYYTSLAGKFSGSAELDRLFFKKNPECVDVLIMGE